MFYFCVLVAQQSPISASFQSMIGGIGHDVQKIKVRLEELQRDVSHLQSH